MIVHPVGQDTTARDQIFPNQQDYVGKATIVKQALLSPHFTQVLVTMHPKVQIRLINALEVTIMIKRNKKNVNPAKLVITVQTLR